MSVTDAIPVWKRMRPRAAPALCGDAPEEARVVIVGAGPVGLALALDLAQRGHEVVVLSKLSFIAAGSKAICFSKRSLDILDRLGVGERVVDKGVRWDRGKVFWKDLPDPVYEFDLQPIKGQKNPAFVNIQQYYVEEYLVDALLALDNVDLRWGHCVSSVDNRPDHALISVDAPDETYEIRAEWLIACDGVKSFVRTAMSLDFEGRVFEDNFLIADVRIDAPRAAERWFHFDPPYPGASSLVHKQPDNVWRLDFQLGWDIDKEAAIKPENVDPFVRGMLGPDVDYDYVWLSVYTFQCRRMARFVHDRVLFAGDSAHVVSPFGARGCNGGFQDIDNLGWKLDLVLRGDAQTDLIESYNMEAITVADENILNSSRSTDFMTPKSEAATLLRDAVLELSRDRTDIRPFVNSGRLSTVVNYKDSSLNSEDDPAFSHGPKPGDACIDASLVSADGDDWLLGRLCGGFTLLCFQESGLTEADARRIDSFGLAKLIVRSSGEPRACAVIDRKGLARERYDAASGAVYLIRPDQHVAARWRTLDAALPQITDALAKAGMKRSAVHA